MQPAYQVAAPELVALDRIAAAPVAQTPYTYFVAHDILSWDEQPRLRADFPLIKRPGFFPLSILPRRGAFDELLQTLESPELSALVGDKLGIDLRDKPRLITIRQWSTAKDGYIHNDSESKIVTALFYLNETWPHGDAGAFRVLKSEHDFEDAVETIQPLYGTMVAFKRNDISWHGHQPVNGERRVVQVTWLRSWEDHARKTNRGKRAFFLKKIFSRQPTMM